MRARAVLVCAAGVLTASALGVGAGLLAHRTVCVTVVQPVRSEKTTPAAEIGKPLASVPVVTRACTEPSGVAPGVVGGVGSLLLLASAAAVRGRRPQTAPAPDEPLRDQLVASVIYAIDRAPSPAVATRLVQDLERAGVRSVGVAGEPFDPARHEAVATVPSDAGPAGVVSSVDEPGYAEGDRLIRPARVVVTRARS